MEQHDLHLKQNLGLNLFQHVPEPRCLYLRPDNCRQNLRNEELRVLLQVFRHFDLMLRFGDVTAHKQSDQVSRDIKVVVLWVIDSSLGVAW